ncbi:peptidase m60, enhancin and enhancin-like domain-containing protein [Hirsutella rhossiliensis]|uniref:Peptidase m60, enhancin and enhancin-like domain-containing protein n=1 Tax=Hirsutella rhossiliensis TaxID=111463 RepID=A0A9P8N6R7_9HYPO|nr:peptidase m60, enhancin and enhancin-like domain-containing protein [Hirsutella rhossiliensis]KAH0968012.1 peptidase m60, enhancin and enhancin-like domain-containing protein [Hirsutella rhossiliensis]
MLEVTVNIYTLAANHLHRLVSDPQTEHATVQEWNQAKAYLAQAASNKDYDEQDNFTKLVMLKQLRVVFGNHFYAQLHRNARKTNETFLTDADKKHYFMTQAAEIAQKDLTPYFVTWGLKPEQRTVAEMHKQPEVYAATPVYGGQ